MRHRLRSKRLLRKLTFTSSSVAYLKAMKLRYGINTGIIIRSKIIHSLKGLIKGEMKF